MSYIPTITPSMICNNIINNSSNPENVWKKVFVIFKNILEHNPLFNTLNPKGIKIPYELLGESLTQEDFKEIWLWMINEYNNTAYGYRSLVLDHNYFRGYKYMYRKIKSYLSKNSIEIKEKDMIKKCIIEFFNKCIDGAFSSDRLYAYELKPLNLMWYSSIRQIKSQPPLTDDELNRGIGEMRKSGPVPDDITYLISSYLKTVKDANQTAGKTPKSKRRTRRNKINTKQEDKK